MAYIQRKLLTGSTTPCVLVKETQDRMGLDILFIAVKIYYHDGKQLFFFTPMNSHEMHSLQFPHLPQPVNQLCPQQASHFNYLRLQRYFQSCSTSFLLCVSVLYRRGTGVPFIFLGRKGSPNSVKQYLLTSSGLRGQRDIEISAQNFRHQLPNCLQDNKHHLVLPQSSLWALLICQGEAYR